MRSDGSHRFADRFGGRGHSVESKTFKCNREKSKYKKKTEGTLFKYKEDFIDTVLNAFKLGFVSSQTFCRGFTITLNRFKKPFVRSRILVSS